MRTGPAVWLDRAVAVGAVVLAAALCLRPMLYPAMVFGRVELLCVSALLLAGILVAWQSAADGQSPHLPPSVFRSLGLFWICAAASWTTSIHQVHTGQALLGLLAWTVIFLCAARWADAPRWRSGVIAGLCAAGVLIATYAVLQRTTLFAVLRELPAARVLDPERLASDRVYATFLSPGIYGSFLALLLPWQIGLADGAWTVAGMTAANRDRVLAVAITVAAGANGLALFLTRSRGAWLAAAVAFGVYAGITRGRWAAARVAFPLAACGTVLLLTVPGLATPNTLVARFGYWKGTLGMIRLRPFLGTGLGTWGDAYPTTFVAGGYPAQMAHNDWLQRFGETGLVGGAAFLLFAFAALRVGARAWRDAGDAAALRRAAGLWCGVFGIALAACFDSPLGQAGVAWCMALALGLMVGDGWGRGRPLPLRRWSWGHAGLMSLLLVASGVSAYRYHRAARAWERATLAAAAGDYAACEVALGEGMRWAPGDPEPYGLLGAMYLYRAEETGAAEAAYSVAAAAAAGAVSRAPWSPWQADRAGLAQWRLAEATGDAAARAAAVEHYRRAATHFPAHPDFLARLADVLTAVGDPGAALARTKAAAARAGWRETPDVAGPATAAGDLQRRREPNGA